MDREKRDYVGLDEKAAYLELVSTLEGGTCSPGGAVAILRVSRQRVNDLCHEGKLRYWRFYGRKGTKYPEMWDISVRDIIEHGVRNGRITRYEDCGISGQVIRDEVARALAQLKA